MQRVAAGIVADAGDNGGGRARLHIVLVAHGVVPALDEAGNGHARFDGIAGVGLVFQRLGLRQRRRVDDERVGGALSRQRANAGDVNGGGAGVHIALVAVHAVIQPFDEAIQIDGGLVRAAVVGLIGDTQRGRQAGNVAHAEGEERVLGQRVVGVIEAQAVELNGGGQALSQFVAEQVGQIAVIGQVDAVALQRAQNAQRAQSAFKARFAIAHLGDSIQIKAADVPGKLARLDADRDRLDGEDLAQGIFKDDGERVFAGILKERRVGKPCAAGVVEVADGDAGEVAGERHAGMVPAIVFAAVRVGGDGGIVEREDVDHLHAVFDVAKRAVQIALHAIVDGVLAHIRELRLDGRLLAVLADAVVDDVAGGGAIELDGVRLAVPSALESLADDAGEVEHVDVADAAVGLVVRAAQFEGHIVAAHIAVGGVLLCPGAVHVVVDLHALRRAFDGDGIVRAVGIAAHGAGGNTGDLARLYAHQHGDIQRGVFARHAEGDRVFAGIGEGGKLRGAGGGRERAGIDGVFHLVARPIDVRKGHAVARAIVDARPAAGGDVKGPDLQDGAAEVGFEIRALVAGQFALGLEEDGVGARFGEGGPHGGLRAVDARPPMEHLRAVEVLQFDGVRLCIVDDAPVHANDGRALEQAQAGRFREGEEQQAALDGVFDRIVARRGEQRHIDRAVCAHRRRKVAEEHAVQTGHGSALRVAHGDAHAVEHIAIFHVEAADGEAVRVAVRQTLVALGGHAGDLPSGAGLDGKLRIAVEGLVEGFHADQPTAPEIDILEDIDGARGHGVGDKPVVSAPDGVGDPIDAVADGFAEEGRQDGHLRSIGVVVAIGVADIAEGRERVGIEAGNVEELRLLAADGLALRVHLLMAHFEDVAFLQAVQRDRVLAAVVVDLCIAVHGHFQLGGRADGDVVGRGKQLRALGVVACVGDTDEVRADAAHILDKQRQILGSGGRRDAHAAGEAALFAGIQGSGGEAVVVVELHEQFPIEAREADFLKGAGKLPIREVGIVAVQQFGNDAQHVVQIVRVADDARNAADLPNVARTPVVIEFVAGLVVCRKVGAVPVGEPPGRTEGELRVVGIELDEYLLDIQPVRAIAQFHVHDADVGYAVFVDEGHGQVVHAEQVAAPRRDGLHIFEDEDVGGLRRVAVVEGVVAGAAPLLHIETGVDHACKVDGPDVQRHRAAAGDGLAIGSASHAVVERVLARLIGAEVQRFERYEAALLAREAEGHAGKVEVCAVSVVLKFKAVEGVCAQRRAVPGADGEHARGAVVVVSVHARAARLIAEGEFKELGFSVERQGVGLRRGGHFVAIAFQRDLYGVRARFEDELILRHAGEDGAARRVFHGVDGRVVVQARVFVLKGDEAGKIDGAAIAHDMRARVILERPILRSALDDLPLALRRNQIAVYVEEIVAKQFLSGLCGHDGRLDRHLENIRAGRGRVEELRFPEHCLPVFG